METTFSPPREPLGDPRFDVLIAGAWGVETAIRAIALRWTEASWYVGTPPDSHHSWLINRPSGNDNLPDPPAEFASQRMKWKRHHASWITTKRPTKATNPTSNPSRQDQVEASVGVKVSPTPSFETRIMPIVEDDVVDLAHVVCRYTHVGMQLRTMGPVANQHVLFHYKATRPIGPPDESQILTSQQVVIEPGGEVEKVCSKHCS